ncbi:hypothetical protein Tco_1293328 [Tanacetum coccineum]
MMGPFKMGPRDVHYCEGTEVINLGPDGLESISDLSQDEKDSWLWGAKNRVGLLIQNSEYFKDKMLLMQAQENGVVLDEEQLLFLAGGQDNAIDEDVDEQPVQDLALNVDNVFQADDVDAYDSDVDEAPTAQTMFMANLSFADPVCDEAGPSDVWTSLSEEENLKKELHSVKLQLASTIKHNKLMVDEVTSLKKDFNQKENKYLEEFLDLKALKDKVEDKLFKQGQSIQTVHMMCKPRKNLLIEHDNIIADGLSKEVFYVASNSELNVSRFTEMQKAHNVVKARCLELEAELSNLRDNIHKDNYNELLNRFSNLEVNHLNLQLKYQNLKDSFQNKPSLSVNDTPDFNFVFVIGQMKASLQGIRTTISQLTEKVNGLQEQNELFRAENAKIKQHYKELYDSIKITRAKHTEQITALKNENESLKVQLQNTVSSAHSQADTLREIVEEAKVERPLDRSLAFACRYTKHSQELLEYVFGTFKGLSINKIEACTHPRKKHSNVPVPPSTGVNSCTDASGSQA